MKICPITCLFSCICIGQANGAKILVLPPPVTKSVFFVLNAVAEELSSRGHEVVILAADSEQYVKDKPLVKLYPIGDLCRGVVNGSVQVDMKNAGTLKVVNFLMTIQREFCDGLFGSGVLEQHRDTDLLLGIPVFTCAPLAAEVLRVPHVAVLPAAVNVPMLRAYGQVNPIAYIPQLESRQTSNMNLLGRIKNLAMFVATQVFTKFTFDSINTEFIRKYNIPTEKSYADMVASAQMILMQGDFALEEAVPMVPNLKMIGPVLPQPAKALDPDLEAFMSSAEEGVVLVSFGSVEFTGLRPREADETMARALAKLPLKVVWKIKDSDGLPIGSNTKTLKWIKQNDILGHPKTRVFVTHVGHNGMYEGAYHGVPMVTCPLWGDQYDNAMRLTSRGLAVTVDVHDLENLETAMYSAVMKIISEPSYSERLKHVSRVMRSRKRTPRQEAADWVEHVLDVKDMSHLVPKGNSIPLYKLYLLDVIGVLVLSVILVFYLIKCLCKICLKCYKRKEKVT